MHGFQLFTEEGGSAQIVNHTDIVDGDSHKLTPEQYEAYRKAKQLIWSQRGEGWETARDLLEDAGFTILDF